MGARVTPPAEAQVQARSVSTNPRPADLVLKNGKIITVDAAFTIAQAIAIAGDRIVAVGPDAAMAAHTGPATRSSISKGQSRHSRAHRRPRPHGPRGPCTACFSVAWRPALDPRHPGSHRRTRPRQASPANGSSPCRSAIRPIISDVPTFSPRSAGPRGRNSMRRRPNNPVFIRSIWGFWRHTLPLVSCANTEALQARRHHPRTRSRRSITSTIEKDANGDPTGVIHRAGHQPRLPN